jgi:hypothetical protein
MGNDTCSAVDSQSKQIVDNVPNEGTVISGDDSENADDISSDTDELVAPEGNDEINNVT